MSYMTLFADRITGERPIETGTCPGIIKIILLRDLRTREFRLCWRAPLILITCAGILTGNVESSSQVQFLFSPAKLPFKSKVARGFLRR